MPRPLEIWLARAAVEDGVLERAQLDRARAAQVGAGPPAPPLGVVLVEQGLATHTQVAELLARRAASFASLEPQGAEKVRAWQFAACAVALGLAAPVAVNRALCEATRREVATGVWVPLPRLLVEQGAVTEDALADFLRRPEAVALADAPATCLGPPPPAATLAPAPAPPSPSGAAPTAPTLVDGPAPPAARAAAPAGRTFGKYQLLAELGRGGMGVVYRALDTELRREVALKTLFLGSDSNPEMVERLLREARTAGTLDHPGIVQIHDVGAVDGTPYFAMTYLRGRTLHDVLKDGGLPSLRDRARVICAAAEAVAHAHERRVIHRDLKPGNLLLDEEGRVHVMDFGLAKRLDEGTRLTASGQMLGTPQYMPPEQIDGDLRALGPATDVYALGAVLYEALTGRPPFTGATVAELIAQALRAEPVAPRRIDARIPVDLETICLKALQREPGQRYPTARELALDLRRYLDGEAIRARPETWPAKATRWVRRRKGVSALAAALVLASLGTVVLGVQAAATRRERAQLARQVLDALRETSAAYLDAALLARRAGAPLAAGREKFLGPLERAARRAIEQAPGRAEPHYHVGRMYRALMRFADARAQQDEALRQEPDYGPSRFERALLLARAYGDRVAVLREEWARAEGTRLAGAGLLERGGMGGEKMRERPADDALAADDARARELVQALRTDLEQLESGAAEAAARRAPSPAPGEVVLAPAMVECIRGLRLAATAATAEERARARTVLAAALSADPTLEEATEVLARLAVAAGDAQGAVSAYTRALAADRGYLPFWLGRGGVHRDWARRLAGSGHDPSESLAAAAADFDRALEIDPKDPAVWRARAEVQNELGLYLKRHGQDPQAVLAQAEADYRQALDLAPGSAATWTDHAMVETNRATYAMGHGQDPDGLFARAETDCGKALELQPDLVLAWVRRGIARMDWATHRQRTGRDPTGLCEQAEKDFTRALEIDPRDRGAWFSRGTVRSNWGAFQMDSGQDPRDRLVQAEADYGKATELAPRDAEAWQSRGSVRLQRGKWLAGRGADPDAHFAGAEADLDRALELKPDHAEGWQMRGNVALVRAQYAVARGQSPDACFDRAEHDFGKAVEIDPADIENWVYRGGLRMTRANYEQSRGREPDGLYRQAEADFGQALAISPKSAEAWMWRGTLRTNWGLSRRSRGQDPEETYAGAEADYGEALKLNPVDFRTWMAQGVLRLNWGTWQEAAGRDPGAVDAKAEVDFSKALAINPGAVDAWKRRGTLRMNWGLYRMYHGQEPEENFAGAESDLGKALALNGRDAEAWLLRGILRRGRGVHRQRLGGDPGPVYDAALADFARALELNPGDAEARWRRGTFYFDLERWAEAIADFDAAARLNPATEARTRAQREEARQRLEKR